MRLADAVDWMAATALEDRLTGYVDTDKLGVFHPAAAAPQRPATFLSSVEPVSLAQLQRGAPIFLSLAQYGSPLKASPREVRSP